MSTASAAPSFPAAPPHSAPEGALTVAAPDYLVVRAGVERFAIPLAAVDEAIDDPAVRTVPEQDAGCLGVLEWRGRRVPLFRPDVLLGVTLERAGAALCFGGWARPCALAVDAVLDAVALPETVVQPVRGLRDPHRVVRGVVRDDAGLVTVLHAAALAALVGAATEAA